MNLYWQRTGWSWFLTPGNKHLDLGYVHKAEDHAGWYWYCHLNNSEGDGHRTVWGAASALLRALGER